jgi:hypothetical protein
MGELKSAAEKAVESTPPTGGLHPWSGMPEALSAAIRSLHAEQLKRLHPLFAGCDAICRQSYSSAPENIRLPGYVAAQCPANLIVELEEHYRAWQAVLQDCEDHNWAAAIKEQIRLRDEYQRQPDLGRSIPSVEEVSKRFRHYRDSVCWKFTGEHEARINELRLQLLEWLIEKLEGIVRERLQSEEQDARRHHVKLTPNLGTWALSWTLNRYHTLRAGAVETMKQPSADLGPAGGAARGSTFSFSPIDEVIMALTAAASPTDPNAELADPLAAAQKRDQDQAAALKAPWSKNSTHKTKKL